MIEFVRGNIFEADVEALVNPVNCVGVMGAGLAKEFKFRYQDNFDKYRLWCHKGNAAPGKIMVYGIASIGWPRYIVNVPTKVHWRDHSKLEDVALGLSTVRKWLDYNGIHSIAIPALGCGLGGLDWAVVKPLIVDALNDLTNVRVVVYEPMETL